MNWYLGVLRKYAQFSGRARRKEYWYFILFNNIIMFGFPILASTINDDVLKVVAVIDAVYCLAVFIPSIAVTVRRLHDSNNSGWWTLLILIPYIGGLILIIFCVLPSYSGTNKYGDNPIELDKKPLSVQE